MRYAIFDFENFKNGSHGNVSVLRSDPDTCNPCISWQVNLLDEEHRLVMVFPRSGPDQLHRYQSSLIGILQDETKLIVRIEKLTSRQYMSSNGTLHTDPSGSELFFYCIDPVTELILGNDDAKINGTLLNSQSLASVADVVSSKLRFEVAQIRAPLALLPPPTTTQRPPSSGSAGGIFTARVWDGFPVALVAIGVLVFLLALAGSLYLCISWARLKNAKAKRIQPFVILPRYDPVIVDPNPKQYETQVSNI